MRLYIVNKVASISMMAAIPTLAASQGQVVDLASPGEVPHFQVLGAGVAHLLGGGDDNGIAFGDVDGDGYDDLIVGIYKADGATGALPDAGKAVVFFGGPDRPPGPLNLATASPPGESDEYAVIYGDDIEDFLGRAVAVGDFNGNGIEDIALGAWGGNGPDNDRTNAGEVVIIWGGSSLRGAEIDLNTNGQLTSWGETRIYGEMAGEAFGWSLTAADINGNGISDLIIGAPGGNLPGESQVGSGRVYILYGSASLPNTQRVMTTQGGSPPADVTLFIAGNDVLQFGVDTSFGDISGDGWVDLLIGAGQSATGLGLDLAGEAFIIWADTFEPGEIYGIDASGLTPPADLTRFRGQQPVGLLGWTVAAGHLSGSSEAEVALGSPFASSDSIQTPGGVFVFSNGEALRGQTIAVTGGDTPTAWGEWRIFGRNQNDAMGLGLAIGDVDGDGLADLLLASPLADGVGGGREESGEVAVVPGQDSIPTGSVHVGDVESMRILGANAGDGFGYGVEGSGDLDGDGVGDFVAASIFASNPSIPTPDNEAGIATVLFGEAKAESARATRAHRGGASPPIHYGPALRASVEYLSGPDDIAETTVRLWRGEAAAVENFPETDSPEPLPVLWQVEGMRADSDAAITLRYTSGEAAERDPEAFRVYHAMERTGPWEPLVNQSHDMSRRSIRFETDTGGFFAISGEVPTSVGEMWMVF